MNIPETISFIRDLYDEKEAFIPLHAPTFAGNEKKYLEECIDTTFVSSVGKFVDLFEQKIAAYTGAKYAVVCVNGTNALHIALKISFCKQTLNYEVMNATINKQADVSKRVCQCTPLDTPAV